MSIYLGFDTSNYTTSVAAVSDEGKTQNIRRILSVPEGGRGLRQSDALFQHIKALPELYEMIEISEDIAAIGVSTRPRNIEGSYMPVFLAGELAAASAAKTAGVPLYRVSHQEGHIMAAIESAGAYELLDGGFISLHLSGGTTEILKSRLSRCGFVSEIIGGTKDISAGQLIDRVGVMMGCRFPAGKELDAIASRSAEQVRLPVSADGAYMNFSGTENKIAAMIGKYDNADIAMGVFAAIAKTLEKTLNHAILQTGLSRVIAAGGVISNTHIREYLKNNIKGKIYFASPELSSDNAVGTALMAKYLHTAK